MPRYGLRVCLWIDGNRVKLLLRLTPVSQFAQG